MDPSAAMERFLHEPRLERKTERSTRRKLLHRLLDWQRADFIGRCPLLSSSVHQDVRQYPARWSTGPVETGGALVGLVLPSQGRTKQKTRIDIGERPAQDQTDRQGPHSCDTCRRPSKGASKTYETPKRQVRELPLKKKILQKIGWLRRALPPRSTQPVHRRTAQVSQILQQRRPGGGSQPPITHAGERQGHLRTTLSHVLFTSDARGPLMFQSRQATTERAC